MADVKGCAGTAVPAKERETVWFGITLRSHVIVTKVPAFGEAVPALIATIFGAMENGNMFVVHRTVPFESWKISQRL